MAMSRDEFDRMNHALRVAICKYPKCRIANCECNSIGGEWKKKCLCMCHFFQMDEKFGKNKWTLDDMTRQSKKGMQL